MSNLWSSNTPARFWQCDPDPPAEQWLAAIQNALPVLELQLDSQDLDTLLHTVLGEGQFGPDHWDMSTAIRTYYLLKPLLPRFLTRIMRRIYTGRSKASFPLGWPIEPRYVCFLWEVMHQLLLIRGEESISFRNFWPEGNEFAFVLTHDIEQADGQAFVRNVADWEESLGFRSSFNFVPERYPLDYTLMQELRDRGFEVAVHGLKHDGRDFDSYRVFARRAVSVNRYLEEFEAVGFAAPLTLRQPEWLQSFNIQYDRSFFDTDPYESCPGGVMSIWPFVLGKFVELPYTLAQDYTLTSILGKYTPQVWLDKVKFIQHYHGMALAVTHPDYLKEPVVGSVYREFLQAMKANNSYWHALPRDVAAWWRERSSDATDSAAAGMATARLREREGGIEIAAPSASVNVITDARFN